MAKCVSLKCENIKFVHQVCYQAFNAPKLVFIPGHRWGSLQCSQSAAYMGTPSLYYSPRFLGPS